MDIYNIQLYSINMVLYECGATGFWFSAQKVGFACLLLNGVSLCPRHT